MDDFEKEMKLGFLEEAEQHLSNTEQCFLDLENNPDDGKIIDQIFRLAHNFKGSANAVGFEELGHFAHQFESLLSKVKTKEIPTNANVISLLLKCNDHLVLFISTLKSDISSSVDSSELLSEIENAMNGDLNASYEEEIPSGDAFGEEIPSGDAFGEEAPSMASINEENSQPNKEALTEVAEEDFEIPFEINRPISHDIEMEVEEDMGFQDALQDALNQIQHLQDAVSSESTVNKDNEPLEKIENVIPLAQAKKESQKPEQKKEAQKPSTGANPPAQAEESIRVSLSRLEKLLNYVGEMVIYQTVLREQTLGQSLLIRRTVHQLGKVSKEIQDISMSLRMVPLKQTFQKMQRIVRDTSSSLGKKINVTFEGEETEVDKTILESISDPLVHLVRNACDHGIESSIEKRIKAGKTEAGNVQLSAFHHAGRLVIEVKDDGGGINPAVLKEKAIEKGILRPGQNISEKEAINLIFHPGFSTKTQVTDVSGRGVGMDVVRSNIEKINGEIVILSEVGIGTKFKIYLPLTLAIIDGMAISCNGNRYIIPLSHIHESVQLQPEDLKQTSTAGELLLLRGENIPMYRLNQMLGLPKTKDVTPLNADPIALVIRTTEQPFAVLVDDIIGQSQVVIKNLGEELQHLEGFAGSAILGDGKPALILELVDLVKKYGHKSDGRRLSA